MFETCVGSESCSEGSEPSEHARTYSSVYSGDAIGTGHARSMLDSLQAWSASQNAPGEWMQIDLGTSGATVVATVVVEGATQPTVLNVMGLGAHALP